MKQHEAVIREGSGYYSLTQPDFLLSRNTLHQIIRTCCDRQRSRDLRFMNIDPKDPANTINFPNICDIDVKEVEG